MGSEMCIRDRVCEVLLVSIALSSTLTRYTVVSHDFNISYDGNDYIADGLVSSVGDTVVTLGRSDAQQTFTIVSDTDVIASFRDETWRNKEATLYRGMWDASTTTLSDVVIIYQGVIDGVSSRSEELFEVTLISIFNRSTVLNASSSLRSAHTQTCLLYTSPSPRDRTRSRMPSSA